MTATVQMPHVNGFGHAKPGNQNARRQAPIADALELQKEMKAATLDPETPPSAKAQCARVWCHLDERIAFRKGRGNPRPVDYEQAKRRSSKSPPIAPVE